MKRQQWLRAVALGTSLTLLAAACGDSDDSDGDDGGGDGEEATADLELCEGADAEATPGEPAETDGFDGETITVAALSPDAGSGTVGQFVGDPLTAGNKAYIDYYNDQEGGIAGKYQIELVTANSDYDADVAIQEYPGLRDESVMFTQILGTPVVDAVLSFLAEDCVLAAPASLDSKWVLEPNLLPIGAPYEMQVINGLDWYYTQEGSTDEVLCVAAQDDEYGDVGVRGVEFAAENLGIEPATTVRFPAPVADRPEQTFETEVTELQSAGCQVVFWAGLASDTNTFADAITEAQGFEPVIIGQSPGWLSVFAAGVGNEYLFENAYFIVEGGQWGDESAPGMDLAMQLLEDYGQADNPEQNPDIYFSFGTYQAMATVQVLEKAVELGDLSRAGMLRALAEVGTLDFFGLYGEYPSGAPADRVPPRANTITKPNAELGGANGTGLEVIEQDYKAEYIDDFEITAAEE